MQSTNKFIISPKGGNHFINEKQIGGQMMVVNTSIEDHKNVNRVGIVEALPLEYEGNVKIGDEVIVQHNVFRDYFDMKGITRKSSFYFKDNLFFVPEELIYLIIRNGKYLSVDDYCFIQPLFEEERWAGKTEIEHQGIVKYANANLNSIGIVEGDKIAFENDGEIEFVIDDERLYKMRSSMILAKVHA